MELEEKIKELEQRVEELENTKKDGKLQKSNLRDFVNKINPKNHRERFKAIGFYLEHTEGKRNFTKRDIEDRYDELKRFYSNPSMMLKRIYDDDELIKDGEDENGATQWRLHAETEKEVEEAISDE